MSFSRFFSFYFPRQTNNSVRGVENSENLIIYPGKNSGPRLTPVINFHSDEPVTKDREYSEVREKGGGESTVQRVTLVFVRFSVSVEQDARVR